MNPDSSNEPPVSKTRDQDADDHDAREQDGGMVPSDTPVQPGENVATDSSASPSLSLPHRHRGRRAWIGILVGGGLMALSQWLAPATDHQMANLATIVVGLITGLFLLYQWHFICKRHGHPFAIPGLMLSAILGWSILFRFEGFSGEMLPQYVSRFSADPPPVRSMVDPNSEVTIGLGTGALTDSLGFLGTERIGMIPERQFGVPTSVDEVEVLWDQGVGEGWSSFAVSGDLAVTLEQRDDRECVTCYRLSDGQPVWIVDHEARHQNALGGIGPRSTPTIVGNRVYAQGATGTVWCIDLNTGETVWSVDLLEMAGWGQPESEAAISWGRAGSPLVIGEDLCVVPYGGPELNRDTGRSLIGLDAKTGETRWVAGEDQISYASPGLLTLGGERQIVSVNEKTITGHRIEDGKVMWETEWFGESNAGANCSMVIPAGENRFLIGKGYGGGSALFEITQSDDAWSVVPIWESNRVLKTKFTHATVAGDTAFAISNGSLQAVEIESGDPLWTQGRSVRFGQGQVLLVEDTIVGQAESGEVVLVAANPGEYLELVRWPALSSKTWNIPTVAGRHLLVRNDRQAIAYRLPERGNTPP